MTLMMMRYIMFAAITFLSAKMEHCNGNVSLRKEYRDMSPDEWTAFRDTLLQLQSKPSSDKGDYSEWDRLTKLHIDYGGSYHNTPLFLHWHRLFVATFEKSLQNINSAVSLPYWDFSHEWQNATRSPLFQEALGLDVKLNQTEGDCRYQRKFITPHCLKRGYTPGNFTQLPSDDFVNLIITQVKTFDQFKEFLEKSIHNPVHNAIGGDMTKGEAPNDPLFWLFHAFIDKIWVDWQVLNPNQTANSTAIIKPFDIPANIAENSALFCYTYQPFSKARKQTPRMI